VEVKARTFLGDDYSTLDNFSPEKMARIEVATSDFLDHYTTSWRRRRLRRVQYNLITVTFVPGQIFGRAVISYFPEIDNHG